MHRLDRMVAIEQGKYWIEIALNGLNYYANVSGSYQESTVPAAMRLLALPRSCCVTWWLKANFMQLNCSCPWHEIIPSLCLINRKIKRSSFLSTDSCQDLPHSAKSVDKSWNCTLVGMAQTKSRGGSSSVWRSLWGWKCQRWADKKTMIPSYLSGALM